MEVSETKKSNKYVLLATYCIAVVCLLLGLFVPLYNGNEILALQLPDALNRIAGSTLIATDKLFALGGYSLITFGSETFALDFAALTVVLYAVVAVFALLALIPIGICFRKNTKADRVIAYIIECAAVIVLSLYLICALAAIPEIYFESMLSSILIIFQPLSVIGANMIIALGGTLLMLIILSIANKKSTGVAKLFLFLLSAIALLMLFDLAVIIPALKDLGESFPLAVSLYGEETGIGLLSHLFADNYGALLGEIAEAKFKAAFVLGTIVGLAVIVNYLIDVISLSTNAKSKGLMFNLIRYSVELAAEICLIVTVAVCGYGMGLFLIVIAAAALIRFAISLTRLLLAKKRAKAAKEVEDNSPMFARPVKPPKQRISDDRADDIIVDVPEVTPEDIPFVGAEPIEIDEKPVPEETAEQIAFIEPVPEPVPVDEPEEEPLTEHPGEVQMEIEGTQPEQAYDEPVWEPVWNAEPAPESEPAPAEPVVDEAPVIASEAPAEPVWDVVPEPVAPQPAPVSEYVPEPAPVEPQPAPAAPQPAPAPEPAAPQPAPVPEPKSEPARTQNTVRYTYGPDGELIYTIRYGGPSDEFIDKLSNDEKIEFAMTFIEKSKGDIGNIPEYVIGGNNKKFFSAVFIYLGRIRGMISDGLLNKMFKELNML